MVLYALIVQSFGLLTILALALGLALTGALLVPGGRAFLHRTFDGNGRHLVAWGAVVATLATSGSLYLSEVVGLLPCMLCWYQRIAMYPLVVVLGIGAWRDDLEVWRYGLPLALIGLLIAAYHVVIQLSPDLDVVTCNTASPCTARYLAVFGWVSIPVMAGGAFLLIAALLLTSRLVSGSASDPEDEIHIGDNLG